MPHQGTPIRYGQKQPVRSCKQGAEKISPRHICFMCKQEIFLQRSSWDEMWIFRGSRYRGTTEYV